MMGSMGEASPTHPHKYTGPQGHSPSWLSERLTDSAPCSPGNQSSYGGSQQMGGGYSGGYSSSSSMGGYNDYSESQLYHPVTHVTLAHVVHKLELRPNFFASAMCSLLKSNVFVLLQIPHYIKCGCHYSLLKCSKLNKPHTVCEK